MQAKIQEYNTIIDYGYFGTIDYFLYNLFKTKDFDTIKELITSHEAMRYLNNRDFNINNTIDNREVELSDEQILFLASNGMKFFNMFYILFKNKKYKLINKIYKITKDVSTISEAIGSNLEDDIQKSKINLYGYEPDSGDITEAFICDLEKGKFN